jgi:hypothetical protein
MGSIIPYFKGGKHAFMYKYMHQRGSINSGYICSYSWLYMCMCIYVYIHMCVHECMIYIYIYIHTKHICCRFLRLVQKQKQIGLQIVFFTRKKLFQESVLEISKNRKNKKKPKQGLKKSLGILMAVYLQTVKHSRFFFY